MEINLLFILNRFVKPYHAGSSSLLFFNSVISCNGELNTVYFFYISTFYQLNILNSSITSVYLSIINHINKYYAQRFLNFHKLPKNTLYLFLFKIVELEKDVTATHSVKMALLIPFVMRRADFVSVKQDLCL